ncbi:MAG: hypothetical protein QOJ49_1483 [Actinomycetota bacterium]|nr:hypothetical protein [Actinomycetota bacterium]
MTAAPLARRAAAEFLGTGLLVTVVVGSGIAAETQTQDPGLRLLENALATAAGLAVLILVFGPVSGGHFNPVISLADSWLGRRDSTGLSAAGVTAYVLAQVGGAIAGAVLANAMYDEPLVAWSGHHRSGGGVWLGEVVATAGLLLVVVALARSGRSGQTAWAVGAYIGSAYWFTSSTSFANPAVTVGRAVTDTFAGIAPGSVGGFVLAQVLGGVLGVALLAVLYPRTGAAAAAEDLVIPRHNVPTERH